MNIHQWIDHINCKNAYREKKPALLYVVGTFGVLLIGYTWYALFTM